MPIPELEKPIIKGLISKDKAFIDGVEVDGTWNTFIVERTQTGYDQSIWDEVASTLEGVTISACCSVAPALAGAR